MLRLRARTLVTLATCAAFALSGCSQIDPLTRPYTWHPTNVNMTNIGAMAANPSDLVRGRTSARRPVNLEADAVDRVWTNKPTSLPGGGGGSSSGGGGGGAPSGGGT